MRTHPAIVVAADNDADALSINGFVANNADAQSVRIAAVNGLTVTTGVLNNMPS